MKRQLTVLFGLTLACLSSGGGRQENTRVYYYGLIINAAVPISETMIENGSHYDLSSAVRGILPDVMKTLATHDEPYVRRPSHNVRLKIVPPRGTPIIVDFGGNVSGLGKSHRLSLETQKRLRRLIFSAFPGDWPEVPDRIGPSL